MEKNQNAAFRNTSTLDEFVNSFLVTSPLPDHERVENVDKPEFAPVWPDRAIANLTLPAEMATETIKKFAAYPQAYGTAARLKNRVDMLVVSRGDFSLMNVGRALAEKPFWRLELAGTPAVINSDLRFAGVKLGNAEYAYVLFPSDAGEGTYVTKFDVREPMVVTRRFDKATEREFTNAYALRHPSNLMGETQVVDDTTWVRSGPVSSMMGSYGRTFAMRQVNAAHKASMVGDFDKMDAIRNSRFLTRCLNSTLRGPAWTALMSHYQENDRGTWVDWDYVLKHQNFGWDSIVDNNELYRFGQPWYLVLAYILADNHAVAVHLGKPKDQTDEETARRINASATYVYRQIHLMAWTQAHYMNAAYSGYSQAHSKAWDIFNVKFAKSE